MSTEGETKKKKIFQYSISMRFLVAVLLLAGISLVLLLQLPVKDAVFCFDVTADMRFFADPNHQSSEYFMGVCQAIRDIGEGAFMVSPGDIDPPKYVSDTIKKVLPKGYIWYPVVGNHEYETAEDMEWLRNWGKAEIPNLVRKGPENGVETTYSFDFRNAHFMVLNQYYDGLSDTGADGDICERLYQWLKDDLEANSRPHIFVFGHEPIVSIPDADNGRHRHKGDNLDLHSENNHRFQTLLRKHKITAYICGHTHNFSFTKINGLWQLDAGHSRGAGDKGARSTFLKVWVGRRRCWADVYRDDGNGRQYTLTRTIVLI